MVRKQGMVKEVLIIERMNEAIKWDFIWQPESNCILNICRMIYNHYAHEG
jgi:hypothetical protein